jgi:hypothetical protein
MITNMIGAALNTQANGTELISNTVPENPSRRIKDAPTGKSTCRGHLRFLKIA